MRTSIDVDDASMRSAMRASRAPPKRAAVEQGLAMLIAVRGKGAIHRPVTPLVIVDTTVWVDWFNGVDTPGSSGSSARACANASR